MIKRGAFLKRKVRLKNDFKSLEHATDLQMLTHFLRDSTQTNAREVVDRETSILGIVHREHTLTGPFNFRVFEALRDRLQTHGLHHLAKHNLDEDTTTARRFVFVHFDDTEHLPGNRIRRQHVSEKSCNISQPVGLVSMNCVVIVPKCLLKGISPNTIQFAEPFPDEAIELGIRPFLRTAFDDHFD